MGIKHLQSLNVRGDHGNDTALLSGFQLCRTKNPKGAEDFVTQHGQQAECNIVVGILFEIAEQAAQYAAAYGEGNDHSVGQSNRFTKGFGNADCAEQGYAHGTEKARRAVNYGKNHNVDKAAEKKNQTCHNFCAASAETILLYHI